MNRSLLGSVNQPVSTSLILYLIAVKRSYACPSSTNCMERSHSREMNSFSASQELHNILFKKNVVDLERGPLSLVSTTEELLDRKVAAPV
jgi:hypothetical protein